MDTTTNKALQKIQNMRTALRTELEHTDEEINRLTLENIDLPKHKASFGEIKQGILDVISAAGKRHTETIRTAIISFVKGELRDLSELHQQGKRLTLGELEAAANGTSFPMANAHFLTPSSNTRPDLALYAIAAEAVCDVVKDVLDQLNPADLGLVEDDEREDMTRQEMRERVTANAEAILQLKIRKAELEDELLKLN